MASDLGVMGRLILRADAQAAIGICRRSGIGRVRHLAVGQLWIQEWIRDGAVLLQKVAGDRNPADAATKHLDAKRLQRCCATLGCEPRAGRSSAAPALAAGYVIPVVLPLLGLGFFLCFRPPRVPRRFTLNWLIAPPPSVALPRSASPPS